ncbi:hypothetical protein [Streptomyces sp. NPDC058045]|uniref:hypothetical protein n=1 Tax=Streptomyces sp. NPDC058045 TaxID=3346311 RepID=UPI0036DFCD16
MFRIRAAALAAGFAALTVFAGATEAAAGDEISGASATVSPSKVPPGGTFTLTVDCSAYANPSPGPGEGQGLAGPVTLRPIGGGRFQGTGRVASRLGGERAVGISGTCQDGHGQWFATVRVSSGTSPTVSPTRGVQGGLGGTSGPHLGTATLAAGSGLTATALGATAFFLYRRRRPTH